MRHLLQRHPFPVEAHFERVLVLTYAAAPDALRPLLPPGLELDTWQDRGFLAAAFVQTRQLRPAGWPSWCGASFFLSGYRVFCRYRTPSGRVLRGLHILRSDTDKIFMATAGNVFTHYRYHLAAIDATVTGTSYRLHVASRDGRANVWLRAELAGPPDWLPPGSPFADRREARRFAGPMPYTFDYEAVTHSMLRIRGVRPRWRPRLVPVEVTELGFLNHALPADTHPTLASCFVIEDVPYRWEHAHRDALPGD